MARLEILCIHAADTPPWMDIEVEDLKQWHMSPRDLNTGGVRYLGKTYQDRGSLPMDKINGVYINQLHGRGWDRMGYSDMLKRDGALVNVTPYDGDDWISNDEMTWGASGINSKTRHIMLEGGKGSYSDDDFFKHFSEDQFFRLRDYIMRFTIKYPNCTIIGHNDVSGKACPGFSVKEFLKLVNMGMYYGGKN